MKNRKRAKRLAKREHELFQKAFVDAGVKYRVQAAFRILQAPGIQQALRKVIAFMGYREKDCDSIARCAADLLKQNGLDLAGVAITAKVQPGKPGEISRLHLSADADLVAIEEARKTAKENMLKAVVPEATEQPFQP